MTPVSDWVTDLVVDQIPIARDVELGMAAVRSAKYKVCIFACTFHIAAALHLMCSIISILSDYAC